LKSLIFLNTHTTFFLGFVSCARITHCILLLCLILATMSVQL